MASIHNERRYSVEVCFVADNRVESECSHQEWKDAEDQLTDYMTTARADKSSHKAWYGIAAIGHYCRFYELRSGEATLHDLSQDDRRRLHIKHNELEVDASLCKIFDLIKAQ